MEPAIRGDRTISYCLRQDDGELHVLIDQHQAAAVPTTRVQKTQGAIITSGAGKDVTDGSIKV